MAGANLEGLDDPALDRLVAPTTVFGRVAPEQKERIVASLRRQGRYVAMIDDGVNDARALKGAQVGVAMKSGSSVTRDVADIVLTDDSTFFCLASFVLILFLAPPTRFFAAWTQPTGDRRPTVMVVVLVAVFAAVLFIPALSNYFGVTGPAEPVFGLVLPALVLWFATLTAVFRFRPVEGALGSLGR